ncbi:hypothetical protein Tco_0568215 [Tanacetum coccineum]
MENYKNVSAVQIILTGIDNDIYSTVDACPNACEMWKAIERLKQGESINVQDLETNLYWEFGKFTSRDGESLESAQVDQGSQIKMIQVKEMMQDNDLKNSKSKDKGSKSRSQSMDEQSHYKQDKTITRQSINVKRHIFNVIGGTEEFEERDLNIGGDC